MALAMLGLVVGSALLFACILILLDRASRPRRASPAHSHACGDSGWVPSTTSDTGTADCSADGGGGCDGGGGGD